MAEFELHQTELELLERASRVRDVIAELDRVVQRDGLGDPSDPGRIHPGLVELRLEAQLLARILVALRLPDDEDVRPQYRGIRGPYRKARAEHAAELRRRLQVVK